MYLQILLYHLQLQLSLNQEVNLQHFNQPHLSGKMLVSALLTSVGINFGLCVLYFTLYSVLRKQPSNNHVYAPRLVHEGKQKERTGFNLSRLVPSPGWVKKAWKLSEDELLEASGLDAVVYMRLLIFSLRVFTFAGIIGVFVLLPVNCAGTQIQQIDFSDFSNNSLDTFTISNVLDGSNWLWFHFCAVYLVTGFVCFLLHYEYKYISNKRVAYFYASKPEPHQFTVLVRSIPVSPGSSVKDSVESFYNEYFPSQYLSSMVVCRTNKLRKLVNDSKDMYRKILHLQADPNKPKYQRGRCCGLLGHKVDLVDEYEKKLEDLEENVRLHQSEASLAGEEIRSAFVSFRSRYDAATAVHLQQGLDPTQWVTEEAPQPHDVYWPFFSSSFLRRWLSKIVVVVAYILLTILFLVPVLIVQGLTNLTQLEVLFPFLESILSISIVSEVVTGYLPSLILQLFLKMVPPAMEFLSSIQGYISHSAIQKSACSKVLWFTVWNVFFATVFSGTVLYQISIILEPTDIPAKLAVAVPGQASFFVSYVVTSGWTSASSELFRLFPYIKSWITRPFVKKVTDDELEVPALPYHRDMPRICFFGLLGTTYFFLAPLILPFLLSYYCLAYIIFRNQFLNVYSPIFETAGKFWPIVHNSMIFSLLLMHCIAVGIFSLKELSLASTLIAPLAIFTLLFNEYCRKRFLPNFSGYSAESLIKKDRENENDPTMDEFLNKLTTAYQDPALLPVQFSANTDSRTSPLLSSENT